MKKIIEALKAPETWALLLVGLFFLNQICRLFG
jgi:hypothetical protein